MIACDWCGKSPRGVHRGLPSLCHVDPCCDRCTHLESYRRNASQRDSEADRDALGELRVILREAIEKYQRENA